MIAESERPSSFFDLYFKYVENTESPLLYHRWCALSLVSTLLGRGLAFPLGHYSIFPNQYILLVGTPGTRKGCAKIPRKLLHEVGYTRFAPERVAKETFLSSLADQELEEGELEQVNSMFSLDSLISDDEDRITENLINSEEFTNFIGSGNFEFLSILAELYDCGAQYKLPLKRQKSILIKKPTINILSCSTPDALAEALPVASIGQGSLSRFVLVFAKPTGKKLTFPMPPPAWVEERLILRCRDIRRLSQSGRLDIAADARGMLDYLYKQHKGLADPRFSYYNQRRFTHLLKVCIACAASELRATIEAVDVILANTILVFTETAMGDALGEFGAAKNSAITQRVIALVTEAKGVVSLDQIWVHVRTELDKFTDLLPLLQGLIKGEKLQQVPGGFLPLYKETELLDLKYVDFSLLREAQEQTHL